MLAPLVAPVVLFLLQITWLAMKVTGMRFRNITMVICDTDIP